MKNLFTISILFLFPALLFSQIKYVPTDYTKIQDAIVAADSGDTIVVEEGRYCQQINFLGKAITVASRFLLDGDTSHISKTIIDGIFLEDKDSLSLVYFVNGEDSTSVLSGFTLQNGKGTYVYTSDHRYSNSYGGAIAIIKSGAKIENNIIRNNTAINPNYPKWRHTAWGGGIESFLLPENKFLIITKNKFYNNFICGNIAMGGGIDICVTKGIVIISQNKFVGNQVEAKESGYGGGICIDGASKVSETYIENNYISNNTTYSAIGASKGAGIACYFSAPTIRNNIIVYNTTKYPQGFSRDAFGGGIAVHWYKSFMQYWEICEDPYSLAVIIENNTIAHNNDKSAGGGVAFRSVSVSFRNNILGGNFSGSDQQKQIKVEYPDAPETKTRTVIIEYCNVEGGCEGISSFYGGKGNIDDFPNFEDEKNWFLKKDLSPCIDAGNPRKYYEDIQDPSSSGKAYFPALGTVRNDIGAFGGPHSKWADILGPDTDVEKEEPIIPDHPELFQNYPNPFNPSTVIKYSIPRIDVGTGHAQSVRLIVYDILGREVATLVNKQQKPGYYEVNFDASSAAGGLTSGVYFYKILVGDFVNTKKMLLLR